MAPESPVVRVGVAAVIKNAEGKMVMGIRRGVFSGKWQFPGGHLEVGESFFACAERETLEEAGIEVKAEKLIGITNDIFNEKKHYITIFVSCRRVDETQEPQTMEPEKCEGWFWIEWSDVKELIRTEEGQDKVFLPIINLLNEHPNIEELM